MNGCSFTVQWAHISCAVFMHYLFFLKVILVVSDRVWLLPFFVIIQILYDMVLQKSAICFKTYLEIGSAALQFYLWIIFSLFLCLLLVDICHNTYCRNRKTAMWNAYALHCTKHQCFVSHWVKVLSTNHFFWLNRDYLTNGFHWMYT